MAKRKAASRRGASRTTAPAAAKKPIPSWMVLALGLGLGVLMTLLFTLKPGGDNVQREQKQASKPAASTTPQPKPKYEFYDMLSNSKVEGPALPDPEPVKPAPVVVSPEKAAEIDTARAMAALNGQVPPPRPIVAEPTPAPVTAPKPAPAAVAPKPVTPPTAQAAVPATPPAAPTPAPQPQAKPQRFYLQAGSFRSRDDADRVRAQIILMGQDARVETGTVNGQTWYRVMSGPFNSREQMSGAQHSLSSAGFQSLPQQR